MDKRVDRWAVIPDSFLFASRVMRKKIDPEASWLLQR
jgi:hypothetical protein